MFNKLQFNNLVISNKKLIEKSRTQTINKTVQKIRNLKVIIEKKPQDEKAKKRLRKALAYLDHMKKVKGAEIVKRILLLEKSPMAIITAEDNLPEEVALATLAMNKTMQSLIERFKTTLNLNKTNTEWKDELMRISKRQEKRNKTEEKRRMRKEVKERKIVEQKRLEWMQVNNPEQVSKTASGLFEVESVEGEPKDDNLLEEQESQALENDVDSPMDSDELPPIVNKTIKKERKKTNEKAEKKKQKPKREPQALLNDVVDLEDPTESEEEFPPVVNKTIQKEREKTNERAQKKIQQTKRQPQALLNDVVDLDDPKVSEEEFRPVVNKTIKKIRNNTKGRVEKMVQKPKIANKRELIQKLLEDCEEPEYMETKPKYEREEKIKEADVITHVVDPFFITETGENYLAVVVKQPHNTQLQVDVETESKNTIKDRYELGFKNRREFRKHTLSQMQNPTKRYETYPKNSHYKSFNEGHSTVTKAYTQTTPANLHPSWAAKQRLKPIISNFQGKRTVFTDDDQAASHSTKIAPSVQNNTTAKTQDLHPSWAAKQRLKPVISNFQGKKTVFADADE